MSATYINYITGEKKETNYQGAPIEGTDVQTDELIVKEGDYLSKFNLGFDKYINHIKFTTFKGEKIELGEVKDETEKKTVNQLNEGNNIILNIKGYSFRIRLKLKDAKYKTECQNKYDKMNEIEKYFFRICSLPKVCFAAIIKYA